MSDRPLWRTAGPARASIQHGGYPGEVREPSPGTDVDGAGDRERLVVAAHQVDRVDRFVVSDAIAQAVQIDDRVAHGFSTAAAGEVGEPVLQGLRPQRRLVPPLKEVTPEAERQLRDYPSWRCRPSQPRPGLRHVRKRDLAEAAARIVEPGPGPAASLGQAVS